jgi:adenylate cyclase, class 2
MRNIELKALLRDREQALGVCRALDASSRGDIYQRDTYFPVPSGRLKLRESDPGDDYLVYYRRPDTAEAKGCDYSIEVVNRSLRGILIASLGTLAVVEKKRTLFLWKNVRIHLDEVSGLGSFIEFEAVLSDAFDDADGHAKVAFLQERFGLASADLLDTSYLEMTSDNRT